MPVPQENSSLVERALRPVLDNGATSEFKPSDIRLSDKVARAVIN
ncbi:hypothetical protein QUB70_01235 [Microcoleus sp. A003_D6]